MVCQGNLRQPHRARGHLVKPYSRFFFENKHRLFARHFFQNWPFSLHAYTILPFSPDGYRVSRFRKPTQSLHKAYTMPTRCLHDAYIVNVKINGNVNSSTSTLISTGTKEAVGVLAEIVWPVCKMLPYWLSWNSLENFLLINVQTIAIQPEYCKIL